LDERAASLQANLENAQETEELKEEIVKTISQELHKRLVVVKGYVDMVLTGDFGDVSSDMLKSMRISQERLERAFQILEAMTTMHELAAPKHLTIVNLNEMCNQAAGRWDKQAKKLKTWLHLETPREPIMALVDSNQISKVFDALISNAIKFSPEGGDTLIRLERNDDGFAHISVTDQGIGISKKDQAQLFERFFRGEDNSGHTLDKTGIGLALVRDIISAHHGKVWVESNPKGGAILHFTLPPHNQ
jgi:signal transduction histidine kinase